MYNIVVFLHVLGAFGFMLAHGASASVSFALRRERSLDRIKALLELSGGSYGLMFGSLFLLLVAGVAAGFMGQWWGHGWIWASLSLLLAISAVMGAVGANFYGRLRKAVGLEYREGNRPQPPQAPVGPEELEALLGREPSVLVAAVGLLGTAIIIWLMMYKPF
jgi:hypothetical protein